MLFTILNSLKVVFVLLETPIVHEDDHSMSDAKETKLLIQGQYPLSGRVRVSGAKNSVLKLMAAALISEEATTIRNVPALSDVTVMAKVLRSLGREVELNGSVCYLHAGAVRNTEAPYALVSKMRASFNVLGALIGRYRTAQVPLPGGCSIGKRGVDIHIKGLQALGVDIHVEHGVVSADASRLKGAYFSLDMPSVGATENLLLACVLAPGQSVLSNVAQEPEIEDLAHFLNAMGCRIDGAGTSTLTIEGVDPQYLKPVDYAVMSDRIECASFVACVLSAGGDVYVDEAPIRQMTAVLAKFKEMGGHLDYIDEKTLRVSRDLGQRLQATDVVTNFYPGFPTDLQSPMMALMSQAQGVSMMSETIYENRFKHVGELNRMGANIQVKGDVAIVSGVPQLSGASVKSHDLRAGMAMVIAALGAEGHSSIYNLKHLDRGYECLHEKLVGLGCRIKRVPLDETEAEQLLDAL
ncbi:MAG: UDP-N-acetylglucosamine 1-carboxyvinyltransferase [Vampirovibrio sp.]